MIQQIRKRVSVGPLNSLLRIGNWDELDPDAASVPYDAELQSLKSIWANSADALVYDTLGSYWDAWIELQRRLVARTGDENPRESRRTQNSLVS